MSTSEETPEEIIGKFKAMNAECQQIANKIAELNLEKDEHKLVIDTLSKLESDRKAYRLVGGVLVERTVGEVFPTIKQIIETLETNLKAKDTETKAYKEKHQIMTQAEREAMLKQQGAK